MEIYCHHFVFTQRTQLEDPKTHGLPFPLRWRHLELTGGVGAQVPTRRRSTSSDAPVERIRNLDAETRRNPDGARLGAQPRRSRSLSSARFQARRRGASKTAVHQQQESASAVRPHRQTSRGRSCAGEPADPPLPPHRRASPRPRSSRHRAACARPPTSI